MSTTVGCSLSVDFDGELLPRNLNVTREKAINVVGPARERHFSLQSDFFLYDTVSPGNISHEYPQNAILDSASGSINNERHMHSSGRETDGNRVMSDITSLSPLRSFTVMTKHQDTDSSAPNNWHRPTTLAPENSNLWAGLADTSLDVCPPTQLCSTTSARADPKGKMPVASRYRHRKGGQSQTPYQSTNHVAGCSEAEKMDGEDLSWTSSVSNPLYIPPGGTVGQQDFTHCPPWETAYQSSVVSAVRARREFSQFIKSHEQLKTAPLSPFVWEWRETDATHLAGC